MVASPSLIVACLCAGWCRTCDAYQPVFAQVARTHAPARFVWVDIETHSDLLGEDVDVENFPTLAILQNGALRFFGTVTPHAATLERLVGAVQGGDWSAATAKAPAGLGQALLVLSSRLPAV